MADPTPDEVERAIATLRAFEAATFHGAAPAEPVKPSENSAEAQDSADKATAPAVPAASAPVVPAEPVESTPADVVAPVVETSVTPVALTLHPLVVKRINALQDAIAGYEAYSELSGFSQHENDSMLRGYDEQQKNRLIKALSL